jgi:hypothetical protein
MMKEDPKSKERVFDELMEGDHVLVHLDGSASAVRVPDHLRANALLTLKLSYKFQGEITPAKEGITAWLRFSGNYEECFLPWDAIWGITAESGEQIIFPDSLPAPLQGRLGGMLSKLLNVAQKKTTGKIEEREAQHSNEAKAAQDSVREAKTTSRARPFLKRIK